MLTHTQTDRVMSRQKQDVTVFSTVAERASDSTFYLLLAICHLYWKVETFFRKIWCQVQSL